MLQGNNPTIGLALQLFGRAELKLASLHCPMSVGLAVMPYHLYLRSITFASGCIPDLSVLVLVTNKLPFRIYPI